MKCIIDTPEFRVIQKRAKAAERAFRREQEAARKARKAVQEAREEAALRAKYRMTDGQYEIQGNLGQRLAQYF